MSTPDAILATYERAADGWSRRRSRKLFERRWLDRFIGYLPTGPAGRHVLDIGCGSGRPIATYLAERSVTVTGLDGASAMLGHFAEALPGAETIHADMRGLSLGRSFDGLIAWDSFFHLSPGDQRAMFPTFAAHAAPGAPLMFTTGHVAGTAIGEVEGEPIYHASLDPEEYRAELDAAGFDVVTFVPEDPDCDYHSVWLARLRRG